MTILTFESAQRAVEKALTQVVQRAQGAINETAQEAFQEAQAAVPVKTGRLRDSGRVEEAPIITNIRENWDTVTTIQYDAPYSADVHEGDGDGRKWLEDSVNRRYSDVKKNVIEKAKV